jgi:hypothetical protein
LIDPLPGWEGSRKTEAGRQAYWRQWLHTPLSERELAAVRKSVTSGRPFGTETWVAKTAALLGLDLSPRPRGRPKKHEQK